MNRKLKGFRPKLYIDFGDRCFFVKACRLPTDRHIPQLCEQLSRQELVNLIRGFNKLGLTPELILGTQCEPFSAALETIDFKLRSLENLAEVKNLKLTIHTSSALVLLLTPVLKSMGRSVEVVLNVEVASKENQLELRQAYASFRRAGVKTALIDTAEAIAA